MTRTALALLAAAVFCAAPAFASTYYVATTGNDTHDGLSPGTSWLTLQHAADTVAPGDTVHVANGNYTGFDVRVVADAADPISFLADGNSVAIVADNDKTPDGINIENAAYITIDGFIVNDRTRAGIRSAVSNHITVRNCHCGHNGTWGIFTGFVDDLLIENNETYTSQTQHGIYTSNSSSRITIRGNHVHDNHAAGIHMNGDFSEKPGDGLIHDALIEDNVIHGNGAGGGSGINMDGVIDSTIRNNLLYDNHASGISAYKIDAAHGSTNDVIVNNTILNASDSRWCININTGSTGATLRNNILYNYHSFHGVIAIDTTSTSGFSSDYNSLMDRFTIDDNMNTVIDFAAWKMQGYDAHSFLATPDQNFFDPTSDFHLLPNAPAIDSGTSTDAPNSDIAGDPRPVGSGYDMGAYEAQLPDCGDGNVDAGEVCGEPSLPACSDPCTTCLGCTCAPATPVCGDMVVCGSEQCETNADCGGGKVCDSCACVNPSICTSGIDLTGARMKARATPFSFKLGAQALIPKPWTGVNPAANGIRMIVDSPAGPGLLDATLPGGAAWKTNSAATAWSYTDATGAVAGITKAVVKDRSSVQDGLLRVTIKGKSAGSATLPDPASVRTTLVLGDSDECALLDWNGPSDASPACSGSSSLLSCR
ncbi:MAG TPA: right-handed parallel beta-helix repeat-containing protein [Candidatus Binatia bacterium]|jgi:hypothetical protein